MEVWKANITAELRKPQRVYYDPDRIFSICRSKFEPYSNPQAAADDFGFTDEKDRYLGGYIALGFYHWRFCLVHYRLPDRIRAIDHSFSVMLSFLGRPLVH